MKKILFVSHRKTQCGVFEYGQTLLDTLISSSKYMFLPVACASLSQLNSCIEAIKPDAILYNYHPSTMPWLCERVAPMIYKSYMPNLSIPQIGISHEMNQQVADKATNKRSRYILNGRNKLHNRLFDYYVTPDPTLVLNKCFVFKTGRIVPEYKNYTPLPKILTIGSFGFGTPNKQFDKIVTLVQNEFDNAIIRFNIPYAHFGDKEGYSAIRIKNQCESLIWKSGIRLQVTHNYFTHKEMLDFLAANTINIFMYQDENGRGISSVIDNALAVQRPIAVSDSGMFRHLFGVNPSILLSKNTIREIALNGFEPLEPLADKWSSKNILVQYEEILHKVFVSHSDNSDLDKMNLSIYYKYER